MRVTFIHPAIGHRTGESYLRSWQMEPLPIATLAGLTPKDIELKFYDDRLETIPFDEATDAVAIPVETYTAKRAYQIASEYRKRGIPVILGGFHVTLVPEEASLYGEAIILGEAEAIWAEVMDDLRHGQLKSQYTGIQTSLKHIQVDRSLFKGKRYLPIGLVETGRGCRFPCEFCAVQNFYKRSYRRRDKESVLKELYSLKDKNKLFFFVDDNFAGSLKESLEWLPELEKLKLRWITQMSINAAHDEAFVAQLAKSGCKGVLIGFESLNEDNLKLMNKRFNTMKTGFSGALANLRRYGIAVYGTFVFGYDQDTEATIAQSLDFAMRNKLEIANFNLLTPTPGSKLYDRLASEGRLISPQWWIDADYHYGDPIFYPKKMAAEQLTAQCFLAKKKFYSYPSIIWRLLSFNKPTKWLDKGVALLANIISHREIIRKQGKALGEKE